MNTQLLSPAEAALKALGISCQSASRFYETATTLTRDEWRDFAMRRQLIYGEAAQHISDLLLHSDQTLPGSPDEDAEWLKEIALRAHATFSRDERNVMLKNFTRTEHAIWQALGELGLAGPPPEAKQIITSLGQMVMEGFYWLGKEKEALLAQE